MSGQFIAQLRKPTTATNIPKFKFVLEIEPVNKRLERSTKCDIQLIYLKF